MEPTEDLLDLGLAIILLRSLLRWSQAELSRQSGIDPGLIADYEAGKRRPSRRTQSRLAVPVGVDVTFIDQLLPLCRGIRLAYESARRGEPAGAPVEAASAPGLAEALAGAAQEALAPYLLRWSRLDPGRTG